jgi:cytochrome b6-f complex iron-sulfur subunit
MAAEAKTSAPAITPMTRREFLYYIWAASMALFTAQAGGALLWFVYPRFKAGTFGGVFELDISEVPPPDSEPKPYSGGRFWLVNIGEKRVNDAREDAKTGNSERNQATSPARQTPGVKAIYMICVHLGCLYQWKPTNDRFECPCHGSKYLATGHRVAGPAARNLDAFVVEALDSAGNVIGMTQSKVAGNQEASAIPIDGVAKLRINTGQRIIGAEFDLDLTVT